MDSDDDIVFEDSNTEEIDWSSSDDDSDDDSDDSSEWSSSDDEDKVIKRCCVKHVTFEKTIIIHYIVDEDDRKDYSRIDALRFKMRCESVKDEISFVFKKKHRDMMRMIVRMSEELRKTM